MGKQKKQPAPTGRKAAIAKAGSRRTRKVTPPPSNTKNAKIFKKQTLLAQHILRGNTRNQVLEYGIFLGLKGDEIAEITSEFFTLQQQVSDHAIHTELDELDLTGFKVSL